MGPTKYIWIFVLHKEGLLVMLLCFILLAPKYGIKMFITIICHQIRIYNLMIRLRVKMALFSVAIINLD